VGLNSLKSLNLTNGYPNKNKNNKNKNKNKNNKVKSKPLELRSRVKSYGLGFISFEKAFTYINTYLESQILAFQIPIGTLNTMSNDPPRI
jgi:hypothetical protein